MKNYKSEQPCIACGTMRVDRCYHHIKSRGSGGLDEPWNLMSLCQEHHNEVHSKGLYEFSMKYESIMDWLVINTWTLSVNVINKTGKWRYLT